MASAIFELCDRYVSGYAALDPVYGHGRGIVGDYGVATDYGPDGIAARAELVRDTLRRLDTCSPTGPADRLAAAHLRERLTAERDWHDLDEPLRLVRAGFGPLRAIQAVADDVRPRHTPQDWQAVRDRLVAVPPMLASWRTALAVGSSRRLLAARRQAIECAVQAERYAGGDGAEPCYQELLAGYGDGPLAGPLADTVRAAYAAFLDTARYLREEYAPRAAEADGIGPERYPVASRLALGTAIDPRDAYEWGWAELRRIEAELAAEARALGADTVEAAVAGLDATEYVDGPEAYRQWLQERHDRAVSRLDGVHFDVAPGLRRIEAVLVPSPGASGIYYTPPSEDLTRPGRTWWSLAGRSRFAVWGELTTVFHEGVPGHHLQLGQARVAGARLSRFARVSGVSGHSEGWALYAERLADELGWYAEERGTRLGMLKAQALKTCRVVVDLGLHLDLPVPAGEVDRYGPRWTFELVEEVLRTRGRCAPHRVHPEAVRYCGWPAQATAYKLGERDWLAARAAARDRLGPAFDLKRWHTEALDLGPLGLATLAGALSPGGAAGRPPAGGAPTG